MPVKETRSIISSRKIKLLFKSSNLELVALSLPAKKLFSESLKSAKKIFITDILYSQENQNDFNQLKKSADLKNLNIKLVEIKDSTEKKKKYLIKWKSLLSDNQELTEFLL